MATTTNYGWTTPDDTALVKDGASAIRTLGSSVDTTTKNLNPSTTLGDIEYRSSTSNVNTRLAIGSTSQVLTVTGGVPVWATPSAGGMTLISETVASGLSSLSLSSIPATYKSLYLVWDGIYNSATSAAFDIRLNNDSGSNYYFDVANFDNAVAAGATQVGSGASVTGTNKPLFGDGTAYTATQYEYHCKGWLQLDNYASTTKLKKYNGNYFYSRSASGNTLQGNLNGTYNSTSAISSIDIYRVTATGTFSNGTNTSILLYGVS
jgi:hypothetical protein